VASWLSPVLIALTAVLLARAHYMLYVLKQGNRLSSVITWLSTVFVIAFWAWHWFLGKCL
jgi:hypothetical protein